MDRENRKKVVLEIIRESVINPDNELQSDLPGHKAITREYNENNPEESKARQTIINYLNELKSEGKIKQIGEDHKGKKYIPDNFPENKFSPKEDILQDVKSELEQARKELKDTYCREPTVDEVADHMNNSPDQLFHRLFRENIKEWRSPSDKKIKNTENEVLKMLAGSLALEYLDVKDVQLVSKGRGNREGYYKVHVVTEGCMRPSEEGWREYKNKNQKFLEEFNYERTGNEGFRFTGFPHVYERIFLVDKIQLKIEDSFENRIRVKDKYK